MSNAVQFLETLSHSPALTCRSANGYAEAVRQLDIEDAQKQALLARNHGRLGDLLGGRQKMMMQIWAPAEDTPQREDDQPTPDDGNEEEKSGGLPDR